MLLHARITNEALVLMHESSLTLPQIVAMHVLRAEGPLPLSRLGDALGLSTSATSSLVDRLVERQYASREEDPDDRRQKRVTLLGAGGAFVERLAAARASELSEGLTHVDPALRAEMANILEQVVAQLRRSKPTCS